MEELDVIEPQTSEAVAPPLTPRVSFESKEIEVGKLKIRPQYQRPINLKRVERMVKNWDDRMVGTLEVSFSDGHYWVMDGQHRLAAMREKGIRVTRGLIHYGLTLEDEAGLFSRLNTQRTVPLPRDIYRAELLAGVERSIVVRDTLAKYGLAVSQQAGHHGNQVAAIQTLWDLYDNHNLDATLDTIVKAWGGVDGVPVHGALEGRVISAIGTFIVLNRSRDEFSLERLQLALSRHTPDQLVREAKTYQTWHRGSRFTLYRWYNYGLKRPLPEA